MLKTLAWVLDGMHLELKKHGKPATVLPCLCDPNSVNKKCRTGEQVGYSCYGCISPHFPSPKGLFRPVDAEGAHAPPIAATPLRARDGNG
jgi:hypothetical protein